MTSKSQEIADQLRDPFLWEHDNVLLRTAAAEEIERLQRYEQDGVVCKCDINPWCPKHGSEPAPE